jgi:hypothetical protein
MLMLETSELAEEQPGSWRSVFSKLRSCVKLEHVSLKDYFWKKTTDRQRSTWAKAATTDCWPRRSLLKSRVESFITRSGPSPFPDYEACGLGPDEDMWHHLILAQSGDDSGTYYQRQDVLGRHS